MDLTRRLADIIAPTLDGMGYDLVRVLIMGSQRQTVQVMAEPSDGRPMTVDDCAEISRTLSTVLDVEDPIPGHYVLEVSSPGIDRPLTRRRDFERWAGFDARVETGHLIEGRKRFTGRLLGLDGDEVVMRLKEGGDQRLPLTAVAKAKLVLTDALLEAVAGEQDGDPAGGDGGGPPDDRQEH